MAHCSCETIDLYVDGKRIRDVRTLDPDCREHGYPGDEWRTGDPIRVHARWLDEESNLRRLESPREVYARLLAERRY